MNNKIILYCICFSVLVCFIQLDKFAVFCFCFVFFFWWGGGGVRNMMYIGYIVDCPFSLLGMNWE